MSAVLLSAASFTAVTVTPAQAALSTAAVERSITPPRPLLRRNRHRHQPWSRRTHRPRRQRPSKSSGARRQRPRPCRRDATEAYSLARAGDIKISLVTVQLADKSPADEPRSPWPAPTQQSDAEPVLEDHVQQPFVTFCGHHPYRGEVRGLLATSRTPRSWTPSAANSVGYRVPTPRLVVFVPTPTFVLGALRRRVECDRDQWPGADAPARQPRPTALSPTSSAMSSASCTPTACSA